MSRLSMPHILREWVEIREWVSHCHPSLMPVLLTLVSRDSGLCDVRYGIYRPKIRPHYAVPCVKVGSSENGDIFIRACGTAVTKPDDPVGVVVSFFCQPKLEFPFSLLEDDDKGGQKVFDKDERVTDNALTLVQLCVLARGVPVPYGDMECMIPSLYEVFVLLQHFARHADFRQYLNMQRAQGHSHHEGSIGAEYERSPSNLETEFEATEPDNGSERSESDADANTSDTVSSEGAPSGTIGDRDVIERNPSEDHDTESQEPLPMLAVDFFDDENKDGAEEQEGEHREADHSDEIKEETSQPQSQRDLNSQEPIREVRQNRPRRRTHAKRDFQQGIRGLITHVGEEPQGEDLLALFPRPSPSAFKPDLFIHECNVALKVGRRVGTQLYLVVVMLNWNITQPRSTAITGREWDEAEETFTSREWRAAQIWDEFKSGSILRQRYFRSVTTSSDFRALIKHYLLMAADQHTHTFNRDEVLGVNATFVENMKRLCRKTRRGDSGLFQNPPLETDNVASETPRSPQLEGQNPPPQTDVVPSETPSSPRLEGEPLPEANIPARPVSPTTAATPSNNMPDPRPPAVSLCTTPEDWSNTACQMLRQLLAEEKGIDALSIPDAECLRQYLRELYKSLGRHLVHKST